MQTDSITIPLPCGKEVIIDAADWPLVSGLRWSSVRGHNTYYAAATIELPDGRTTKVFLHRVLLKPPSEIAVDHKNRNGLDCRRENLRYAIGSGNEANRAKRVNGKVPFKGIVFDPRKKTGRWGALIGIGRHRTRLGCFNSAEDAARAYDAAARELFGEFARVNFPEEGEAGALEGSIYEDPAERSRAIAELEQRSKEVRADIGPSGRRKKGAALVQNG